MSKYFNTLYGCLTASTDGVPDIEKVTELSDLEYSIMELRLRHTFEEIYKALEVADDLYEQVGK